LSQIVDWCWKLADLTGTASLAQLFGAAEVDATTPMRAQRMAPPPH
jgi:hypothetical protein